MQRTIKTALIECMKATENGFEQVTVEFPTISKKEINRAAKKMSVLPNFVTAKVSEKLFFMEDSFFLENSEIIESKEIENGLID